MNKVIKFLVLVILICVTGILVYFVSLPKGNTVESREDLLDDAIRGESEWEIVKEIKIDDYIISCGYSENNKATIAVFVPTTNGRYKFLTSTNRHNKEIIIGGVNINNDWYDLIWFNGAQTEYAEVSYTINNETKKTTKYDTRNMDLISIKNNAQSYKLDVYYYDNAGNRYE